MPIHVALSHRTSYRYDRLVALSPHVIRLRPAPHCRTPILSYSLKVVPNANTPTTIVLVPGNALGVDSKNMDALGLGWTISRPRDNQPLTIAKSGAIAGL